jgi:hypothetical protein
MKLYRNRPYGYDAGSYTPPSSGTAGPWSDNFNRANEDPITGWTLLGGSANLRIGSYLLRGQSLGINAAGYYTTGSGTTDHYSSIKVCSKDGGGGPAVRMSGSDFYMFDHWESNASLNIWKVSSLTFTGIASKAGTVSLGDIMTIAVSKGTLTAFVNSTSQLTGVDSSFPSGGFGMQIPDDSADAYDDWNGGNL